MNDLHQNDITDLFVHIPEKRWGFLQTRAKHEKQAMRTLASQGVIVYLPLITKVEIHNRGKRERYLPMFQGYVFTCSSMAEDIIIRRNKYVWNLKTLSAAEEESLLKDLKIVRECELLSAQHKLVVKPQLQEGDKVFLKNGPFKKHEVIVVKRKDESNIIVNLEFLGRSIEITCNAEDLVY